MLPMQIGIYNRWLETLGGGERYSLAIAAALRKRHDVTVIGHTPVEPGLVSERLRLDLDGVHFVSLPVQKTEKVAAHSAEYDLFINASHGVFFANRARHGAMVVFFPTKPHTGVGGCLRPMVARQIRAWTPRRLYTYLFEHRFREIGTRLEYPVPSDLLAQLGSYEQLWAISQFTQGWIARYWQRESRLLYPPVATTQMQPGIKRNWIISVGRFFSGHHSKKHAVMVQAFRELIQEGSAEWELHLVGGTNSDPIHQEYLMRIRSLAAGAPVFLHTDIPFARLRELYATSAIYWHAAGYGESETAAPERLEHFGISTVEAMAAGCVPVVLGRGGQRELINHGTDGYLWYTTDQLKTYTRRLVDDPDMRRHMAEEARMRSRQYDERAFESRLSNALARMGLVT